MEITDWQNKDVNNKKKGKRTKKQVERNIKI